MVRMNLLDVYGRMPVAIQNVFATAHGVREFRVRHTGEFGRFVRELDARQWWSADRLVEDQDSRVRRIAAWCGACVPHYRDLFAELGIGPGDIRTAQDLRALPILEKETVRAQPDRFVPDVRRPKLVAQTTGGTTGTPLRYWATPEAVQFNFATYESRTRKWAGVKLGDRMASFQGQPIVPAEDWSGPFWRRNPIFNQLYFSIFHMNDRTLPRYVEALERFRPKVIVGYPSGVHPVAAHMLAVGDVGRVRPTAVIVSSETLLPSVRDDLELAFGCKVFNAYSLGELVTYASECDHGELHVSTEYGVVEHLRSGDHTEIIASGLNNLGMPLLRYRTGDLAVAAEGASACGRELPRLEALAGRIDDLIQTPEGALVGPTALGLTFKGVSNIRRAQFRQDSVERLSILLEVADGFGPADQQLFESQLRLRLGHTIGLDFERTDAIARTSGGKERLVVSSLPTVRA
jgi:phenylacetate-CoA ligase